MSRLTFTLKERPDQRLDLSALVPEKLQGLSRGDIEQIAINTMNPPVAVGDVFMVTGSAGDEIVFACGHERFDGIGASMTGGLIRVDGDCGAYLGRGLSGGRICVTGSAGPFAGAAMASGVIEIKGKAGDFAGGSITGEMHGMTGGILVVQGAAGRRIGDRMRRGLIVVGGDAGELAGSRMIAGSILVLGRPGPRLGSLMRRGTILCGKAPRALLPTFNDCGRHQLLFTNFYTAAMTEAGVKLPGKLAKSFRRFAGDMAILGKGEVLLAET
jgi:formylmethanofuran dehydrogenase subunit C